MIAPLGDNTIDLDFQMSGEENMDKKGSHEDKMAVERMISDNIYKRMQLDVCLHENDQELLQI